MNNIIDELLGLLGNTPVTSQPAAVYVSESTSVPTTEPTGMPHNLYPQLGGSRRFPSRLLPLQEFDSPVDHLMFDMVIQNFLGNNTSDPNSGWELAFVSVPPRLNVSSLLFIYILCRRTGCVKESPWRTVRSQLGMGVSGIFSFFCFKLFSTIFFCFSTVPSLEVSWSS